MEGAHNSRGAAASIGGLPEEVLLRVFAGLPTPDRLDVCSVALESIGPMLDSPDPGPPRTRHHAPYQNAPIVGRRALWWLRATHYDPQASPTARVPSMGVASRACELGVGRVAFDVAYGYDIQREAAAPVQRSLPCDWGVLQAVRAVTYVTIGIPGYGSDDCALAGFPAAQAQLGMISWFAIRRDAVQARLCLVPAVCLCWRGSRMLGVWCRSCTVSHPNTVRVVFRC